MSDELSIDEAQRIATAYFDRRNRWPGEDERMSLMVVLMNYGDQHTRVECVGREWSGTKGDLPPRDGVPLCPNGHPMFEVGPFYRLGLVEAERP